MAKEEKKTTFGDKYLNALKGAPRITRDAVINAVNKDNDKRLQYAGENNTVDFNDALRRAKTTVDPFARTEASDDKDNPEYEKPVIGQRSIDWRIKKAQARLDREDASFRTALDEKILETEKDINLFMDEEETDILSSDGLMRGYRVVMQRTAVPEKAKSIDDLNVMLGGKKVSVFKELEGESVRIDCPVPEYSKALVKKAAEEIALTGNTEWTSEVKAGDNISLVSMNVDASVGKIPVTVVIKDAPAEEKAPADKGPEEVPAMNEGPGGNEGAVFVPAGKYISKAEWDSVYEKMESLNQNAFSYTINDGTVVKCWISAQHNGKDMAIEKLCVPAEEKATKRDIFPCNDTVNEGGKITSKGWDSIYKEMLSNHKQMYSVTNERGDRYDFRLNVEIDGDKRAKIDYAGALEGDSIGDIPAKIIISKETWEDAVTRAANDPSLSGQSQVEMPDGKKLNVKVKTTIDGKEAIPNIPVTGDDVRQYRGGGAMVSRDFAQKAIDQMETEKSTFCKLVSRDGREFRFAREGRLTLFVNGKEFSRFANNPERRKGYKAALSEVAGLMNSPEEEKKGMDIRAKEAQKTIARQRFIGQLPLTGAGYAVRTVGSELRRADMTSSSILSALLHGATGATRSVGR